MTASEKSFIGLAKQTGKGTPNTTDAQFSYLLYREGALGVLPTYLPLDMEVGGGAVLRNVLKTGVMTGGQLSIIPRPKTLGMAFLGMTGSVNSVDGTDGSYEHTFELPADQFDAPWYTLRSAPGQLLGEQFADSRFSAVALSWRAGRFVEGALGIQGIGVPSIVSTATWDALPKVDGGPQFLAPLGTIELPDSTPVYVTGLLLRAIADASG